MYVVICNISCFIVTTIIIDIYSIGLTIFDETRFLVKFVPAIEEERSFMKFRASLSVANFLYIDPGNLRT